MAFGFRLRIATLSTVVHPAVAAAVDLVRAFLDLNAERAKVRAR